MLFLVFCWNIFIDSRTLIFRALNENKIRQLPDKIFYGPTALQQLWVYRLNFFVSLSTGQATRRFNHPLGTALLYGISIYYFDIIPIIFKELEILRFLRTFLKSSQKKKKKKPEFLQFRGGLILDSIIVYSSRILNYYNSIITIIISLHFTCKPSSWTF